ncbi:MULTISPECIES: ABC transporter ATP-binding protein [unclassified Gilliamella]|jgi:putative tryptophan/tyrosine transport system ATP-binding protein|uniref:ABC transporter ATP-binding protein n=1 Tax=unclassified Gilliamella TaxID=2685620 RepID=UPI00080E0BE8|nr:ABC transporter ATP-binding protein [Gilliamella apicola]OCG19416.1 ABC transporter ATP-binding protein [Gilliamella apicola]OCG26457.1 ABC transporter ATP-binding protein [Gilliamella apicola]OCG30705.1 ABC transporter ATP-binding protein [Gilliamella apicola]OCG34353.1 ABC transporter ATP-binding protein [Gilliamella apicola]OCG56937.1 ABC transporter ATP-binding protein [Gilliamella apicola]
MIKVEQLQLTFNQGTPIENYVLRGLNLKISEGEFVTIIGSNGAGKSSLLNVISGDLFADSGSVVINEQNVSHWPAWKRASMVARVFQDPMVGTCENLTIEENLAIAYNRGHRFTLASALNNNIRSIFKEKLATLNLGLENRLSDMMGLLSGGQRQAISLLMSTLKPSKILLLDEHTAALDPKTAQFVLDLTDKIVSKNHLTTMMVTHSMKQALEYGNRTVMLHQGQVVLDVSGEQRAKLTVTDLLDMFEKTRGEKVTDDALLLG